MWNLPGRNGKMPNLDKFDSEFFGIPESEVNYIDPQERLLLEATYEAIIDAGKGLIHLYKIIMQHFLIPTIYWSFLLHAKV